MYVCVLLSTQLCLTLCDPIDCSPPGSSGHGILQARILEWVAMPSSGGSSRPKGSNSGLPDYRWILYHLSHQRKQGPRAGREWRRNPWPFLPPPVGKTKSQPVRVLTMAPSSRVSSWGLRRCGGNPAGQCWNSSCLVLERLWGDTPWPSAEKSQQDSRRGKLEFRLEPIPTRDTQRSQTSLVRTRRPHRDWARTVFQCLLWRYRSAVACRRGRGSRYIRPGYGISPLGGGRH